MNDEFKPLECNDDDVVSFPGDITFKVSKFRKSAQQSFSNSVGQSFSNELKNKGVSLDMSKMHSNGQSATWDSWFKDGIDCEILNLGSKSWKKGKVRIKISVEFLTQEDEPEISEPESPLDDIRRIINQDNQNQNH